MSLLLIAILLGGFAWLAWRDLKLALMLIACTMPIYLLRFDLLVPWTVLEACILIAFGVWLMKHHDLRVAWKSLGVLRAPLACLIIVATLAILWAPDQLSALGTWKAYFIEPLLVLVMLRTTLTQPEDWQKLLNGLGLSVIMIASIAILQKLTGLGLPIPWDTERRVTSVFEYPNAVGLYLAPIVAALIISKQKIAYVAVPLGLIAIYFAKTEAALVAIPASVIFSLAIANIKAKSRLVSLLLIAVLGVATALAIPSVRAKLFLQDYSGGVRRSQWTETLQLLSDRPFQGAGLSGYPTALAPYHDSIVYEIFQYPHNLVLNFWVELGILGVIAGLWLGLISLKLGWQGRDNLFALTALTALVCMAVHGLVDVPFFKNDLSVLTAIFLAMLLASNKLEQHS
ncbi:MAG: O-antigen ligase family protein [Patescibacteria group bacterium]